MSLSNVDQGQSKEKEPSNDNLLKRNIPLIFLVLLIVSIIGYFSSDSNWLEFTFAHLGGLFIVGFMGHCSGIIAMKKGYNYWKAFSMGFFLPIGIGFTPVFLFKSISCGGSISLAVALLIVLSYLVVKRRVVNKLT
jgi:hypothetical protein